MGIKAKTDVVMSRIIQQIREKFPFSMSDQELCTGICYGCPKKLLEYIDMESTEWQQRLENGEVPNFQDIEKITKVSRKIFRILEKNDLVSSEESEKRSL
jgi:hypothetical protein